MKKKIVFVNASLTGGGSERVMVLVANYCADNGCDVEMILLREKKRTYAINPKIKLVQLDNKAGKLKILYNRIIGIRKHVKEFKPDAVVAFMDDIAFFTIISLLGLHKKIIFSIRNDPRRKDKKKFWYIIKYINIPFSKRVVFQTEQAKECFGKQVDKKGVVIPNPINSDIAGKWEGLNSNRIIAVGRITEQKRFDIIIDAFLKFRKNHPEYILDIYGEGPDLKKYKQMIQEKGAQNVISFKGFSNNILDEMRKSEIYISCSDFEGISNTMLEAMAIGVPTICTDCPIGGAAMTIKNNINGILIPVKNIDAAEKALSQIADNKKFAIKLSEEAVKIREEYNIENIGAQWIKEF